MAFGSQVNVPVREFDRRCGTHAFRGVIVYVKLSIRCACALRELCEVGVLDTIVFRKVLERCVEANLAMNVVHKSVHC